MKIFKPSLITAAFIASGFSVSGIAVAQQDDVEPQTNNKEELEVIEVKGFSTSLIQSLNQKRFSDTVSEQLSADDLGGLPDVSMADALTRLPGISAVRTGGQAAEINIRGMSGGFVFSTLNGREQVSTSGSRSIEFDQYPSELISSAAVYKSPKASLIEGGVAGSVELATASPLSNDKQHTFNLNARGMFNDRAGEVSDAKEFGHRLSFSYQGQFLDETLGVALGYARLFQPSVSTQFIGLAYDTYKDVDGVAGDTGGSDGCPECELISEGFELQHKGGEETRNGYVATVEWVPHDDFKLKADAFVSTFDSDDFARGYRIKFGGASAAVGNPVLDGNSVIGGTFNRTSGSFTRVEIVNDDNTDYDEVRSYGINANWQATDALNLALDISYSSAESDFRNGLLWALVAEDANADSPVLDTNVSVSYLLHGLNLPDVGFNQASAFTDTDKVMVSKYGIYPFVNSDEVTAYRLDFKYNLYNDFIASVEGGVRYSSREYSNDRSVFEYGNDGALSVTEPPLKLTDDMVKQVSWEGEFANFPDYLAIDLGKALNAWFPNGIPQPLQTWGSGNSGVINPLPGSTKDTAWSVLQSGKVYEDVTAAYLQANIDTLLFDVQVTGNLGVRMVRTDQSATALTSVGGDPELGAQYITDEAGYINDQYAPEILGETYTDYLPSLNLNFHLTDNQQLRFAAAKVMARPPINRLAADISYSIDETPLDDGSVEYRVNGNSSNNPYLRPFYATQYDLSFEHYFEETDGAFVAALFYKDIESFVSTFTISGFDFRAAGIDYPEVIIDDNDIPRQVVDGDYTTAVNNDQGGYIRGAELAYTQIFSFLPDMWSGLGMNIGYSYTESEIQQITNLGAETLSISLPGLSENVFSTTLFWEHEGFETRLSMRYRDAFVSEQVAVNEQIVNFDGETVLDYQASYEINDNLSVLFQVNNLTDEPTKSYFGSEAKTGTIQYFGRQFFLGLTYSL